MLGVQWIAARTPEQRALLRCFQQRSVAQRCDQLRGLLVRQRRERNRGGVDLAATPAGTAFEQFPPGRAEDQDRNVGHPVGEVLDEIEQPVVRPLNVLEDEDERMLLGQRLEEAAPRGERFFLRPAGVALTQQRPQV